MFAELNKIISAYGLEPVCEPKEMKEMNNNFFRYAEDGTSLQYYTSVMLKCLTEGVQGQHLRLSNEKKFSKKFGFPQEWMRENLEILPLLEIGYSTEYETLVVNEKTMVTKRLFACEVDFENFLTRVFSEEEVEEYKIQKIFEPEKAELKIEKKLRDKKNKAAEEIENSSNYVAFEEELAAVILQLFYKKKKTR